MQRIRSSRIPSTFNELIKFITGGFKTGITVTADPLSEVASFAVNVDNSTIGINGSNNLQVKDAGITKEKINADVAGTNMFQDTDGSLAIARASTSALGVTILSNSYTGTHEDVAITEKALSDGLASFTPPRSGNFTYNIDYIYYGVTPAEIMSGTSGKNYLIELPSWKYYNYDGANYNELGTLEVNDVFYFDQRGFLEYVDGDFKNAIYFNIAGYDVGTGGLEDMNVLTFNEVYQQWDEMSPHWTNIADVTTVDEMTKLSFTLTGDYSKILLSGDAIQIRNVVYQDYDKVVIDTVVYDTGITTVTVVESFVFAAWDGGTVYKIITPMNLITYGNTNWSGEMGGTPNPSIQADDTILQGQPVYIKSNGHIGLAKADVLSTSKVVGFAVNDTAISYACEYQRNIITLTDWSNVVGTTNLIVNNTYFLDAVTAGKISNTSPSAGVTIIVGEAISTTSLEINILYPILL